MSDNPHVLYSFASPGWHSLSLASHQIPEY